MNEFQTAKSIASYFIKSGFLPQHIKTPEQALTIILAGREMGLGPWTALQEMYAINGKVGSSAKLQLALVYRTNPNHRVEIEESTNERCVIRAKRAEENVYQTFTYNIDDAKAAGRMSGNYLKYTRDMLRARNITQVVRAKFPECALGMGYEPSELGSEPHPDDTTEREGEARNPNGVDEHRHPSDAKVPATPRHTVEDSEKPPPQEINSPTVPDGGETRPAKQSIHYPPPERVVSVTKLLDEKQENTRFSKMVDLIATDIDQGLSRQSRLLPEGTARFVELSNWHFPLDGPSRGKPLKQIPLNHLHKIYSALTSRKKNLNPEESMTALNIDEFLKLATTLGSKQ